MCLCVYTCRRILILKRIILERNYARNMLENKVSSKTLLDIEKRLNENSPIDMMSSPQILRNENVYKGRIFSVDDRDILLQKPNSDSVCITRQIVRHPPAVVMLVHDCTNKNDRYLVEREYRVGLHAFTFGIPAGLCDPNEKPLESAIRELREETGIIFDPHSSDVIIETVGEFYSSEGMSNERAYIMVIHLQKFSIDATNFDADEYVESGWVSWDELLALSLKGASANLAIQHEQIRRLIYADKSPFEYENN